MSKKEGMNNILAAIDAANNGYSYFPFSLERFCTHGITDQDRLDTLSTQEMKVFRLYSQRRRLHHHRQQNEYQQ
ncbi:transcription regulator EvgA [Klebsiella pneumoniae]|uniref:Transcription regulator EvgA n=1 Tax=Klebsiella pneumoniae TaxID=573 RepID=A0A378A5G4_KLEPN|nr:transcription regulator EvgA [Klebsiella pneumoniae]